MSSHFFFDSDTVRAVIALKLKALYRNAGSIVKRAGVLIMFKYSK